MKLNENITGKTKLLGLFGNPVEHTISPQLHNTLSELLGIDAVYIPMKVGKDSLGEAVKGMKACGFLGFNATIPFKEELLRHVDEITEEARLMGCANTVKNIDGRLLAYNTDAEGFVRSFEEELGCGFAGKKIALLGAGGTARSLGAKLVAKGAARLHIINRTIKKAEDLAAVIGQNTAGICTASDFEDREKLRDIIKSCDIIVNTTSAGMHPNTGESPLGGDMIFNGNQLVYDVIYNPSKTMFLKQAESFGCRTANGLGMLFYQGILAYEIWMDIKIPEHILRNVYTLFSNYLRK